MQSLEQTLVTAEPGQPLQWAVGDEPIPGYRLCEPLGSGGFGIVWKCEAPGGLFKAIKAVTGDNTPGNLADREFEALQCVKRIRHPFILSLDRLELVNNVLLIVMELADKNLHGLQSEARERGLPGLPREQLLSLLLEAAEALDWMNFEHGLQHLDIKPHNLFLVSNHLKIADFGLVSTILAQDGSQQLWQRGATPLFASPEILRGSVSSNCDQYSLAIVYQQMLTGTVPFWSTEIRQLVQLHLHGEPNLTALPSEDRAIVARALAKDPDKRFPSCLAFAQALVCGRLSRPDSGKMEPVSPSRQIPILPRSATASGSKAIECTRLVPELAQAAATPNGTSDASIPTPTPMTPSSGPQSAGTLAVPGLRFIRGLGHHPLGDLWQAADDAGTEFRVLTLAASFGDGDSLFQRLRAIRHPSLPPCKVVRVPEHRLALATLRYERTLGERFEMCRAAGTQGVSRGELLHYLRSAAQTLDALFAQWKMPHLALNPRNLLLDGKTAWVADYGQAPLLWQPSKESLTTLNPRYAAPELADGQHGPAADQYALALIFAEMLTGLHPRVRGGSGLFCRLGTSVAPRVVPTAAKPDLEAVAPEDRPILMRALSSNPAERFESCLAFIRALEKSAAATMGPGPLLCSLPLVLPVECLSGQAIPVPLIAPSLEQLLATLARRSDVKWVAGGQRNARYLLSSAGVWEYQFSVDWHTENFRRQLEAFRHHWNAQVRAEGTDCFQFSLSLPGRGQRGDGNASGALNLQLTLKLKPAPTGSTGPMPVLASLHLTEKEHECPDSLDRVGPQLFESLRHFVQPLPEKRAEVRWPCGEPVRVFPLLARNEVGPPLPGTTRDLARTTTGIRLERWVTTQRVYLHWPQSPEVAGFAVLARVLRCQPDGTGSHHLVAHFSAEGEPTA